MTTTPDASEPTVSAEAWHDLDVAVHQLRGQPVPRAVEVANNILQQALRSTRTSLPIRANPPFAFVRISDQVLISRLRQAVDAVSETHAVGKVILGVEPDQTLQTITVELFVQYGEVLIDTADAIRGVLDGVVRDLLGPLSVTVRLVTTHVHISDITIGSPHNSNPSDPP